MLGLEVATRAPKAAVAMCIVQIGYENYALPVAAGLRIVELMKDAKLVDQGFARVMTYYTHDEPVRLTLEVVRASQIVAGPAPDREISES